MRKDIRELYQTKETKKHPLQIKGDILFDFTAVIAGVILLEMLIEWLV